MAPPLARQVGPVSPSCRAHRRLRALAAQVAAAAAAAPSSAAAAAAARPATAMTGKPTPVVTMVGRGEAAGRQHGSALAAEIGAVMKVWRRHLRRAMATATYDYNTGGGGGGGAGAEEEAAEDAAAEGWTAGFVANFLGATDYLPAIERWAPGLLAEIRGIAAGAGVDPDEMLVFQMMDEYWSHGGAVVAEAAGATPPEHCTTVACGGGAGAVVAQNMDLESLRDGSQCVLRLSSEGEEPAQLLFSHAGMIALCGVNSAGVSVAVNNLAQLPHGRSGQPNSSCLAQPQTLKASKT